MNHPSTQKKSNTASRRTVTGSRTSGSEGGDGAVSTCFFFFPVGIFEFTVKM